MTREDFLQNQWPPYPHCPDLNSGAWVCGKVASIRGNTLFLQSELKGYEPQPAPRHAVLGPSFPLSCARRGDSVALMKQGEGRFQGPYLLSPNLLPQEALFSRGLAWQEFLEKVRGFFISCGFRHWSTPSLLASSGVDAHIDFITAQGVRTGRTFYLPTSPEFELKKAMADGEKRLFEVKSCFRDDDASPIHRVEFTMLEWYRAYDSKWSLIEDFEGLLAFLSADFGLKEPLKVQKVSMAQLFERFVKFVLTPQTTWEQLRQAVQERGLHLSQDDDWDDLFFRLYIEFVEPQLGWDGPVAVYDFPASQNSLSRRTEAGWADRFEIYWQGVELANAYQEQNNPYLISEVVEREIGKRQSLRRVPHQKDEAFLQAMQSGFPPAAGAALGLDRLFMVLRKSVTLI